MKTTRYVTEQVLRKRPYVTTAMCAAIIADPIRREAQADGRIRQWGVVILPGEAEARILRVVTLEDGQTTTTPFWIAAFARRKHEAALLSRDR